MHQRAFVLAPLHELAPDLQIPGRGPVRILLDAVKDQALQRQGPLMEE
jgi:2-amino-4-hydroxy-6-hydroxymethyldihydropteridine diphosphokinase